MSVKKSVSKVSLTGTSEASSPARRIYFVRFEAPRCSESFPPHLAGAGCRLRAPSLAGPRPLSRVARRQGGLVGAKIQNRGAFSHLQPSSVADPK